MSTIIVGRDLAQADTFARREGLRGAVRVAAPGDLKGFQPEQLTVYLLPGHFQRRDWPAMAYGVTRMGAMGARVEWIRKDLDVERGDNG